MQRKYSSHAERLSDALYACAPSGDPAAFKKWHREVCAKARVHPDTLDRWLSTETAISGENQAALVDVLGPPFILAMYGYRVALPDEATEMEREREAWELVLNTAKGRLARRNGGRG